MLMYASSVTEGAAPDVVEVANVGIPEETGLEFGVVRREVVEAVMVLSGITGPVILVVVLIIVLEVAEGVVVEHGHVVIVSMIVAVTVAV